MTTNINPNNLDPTVWGPHFWFTLHTIAFTYPDKPNSIIKKRYYDFIHNFLPLIIPNDAIMKSFSVLLDQYPISAYLDSKDQLISWFHFIHNQINQRLEKQTLSKQEFMKQYLDAYKPKLVINEEWMKLKEKMTYTSVLVCLIGFTVYLTKM